MPTSPKQPSQQLPPASHLFFTRPRSTQLPSLRQVKQERSGHEQEEADSRAVDELDEAEEHGSDNDHMQESEPEDDDDDDDKEEEENDGQEERRESDNEQEAAVSAEESEEGVDSAEEEQKAEPTESDQSSSVAGVAADTTERPQRLRNSYVAVTLNEEAEEDNDEQQQQRQSDEYEAEEESEPEDDDSLDRSDWSDESGWSHLSELWERPPSSFRSAQAAYPNGADGTAALYVLRDSVEDLSYHVSSVTPLLSLISSNLTRLTDSQQQQQQQVAAPTNVSRTNRCAELGWPAATMSLLSVLGLLILPLWLPWACDEKDQ